MPAVSVVVPCFNGGRFLDGLLASFAAQTFRDFEIIIIDDGSSDPQTLARLAAIEPAVRVIRQDNRGLPAARNTGFRAAVADLVLPVDCDDRLEAAFLAETTEALQNAPDAAAAFTYMRVHGLLNGVMPRHCNHFDQLFLNQLPYCMLMRKSAWSSVGGYDETMRNGYEDWEFNLRLLAQRAPAIQVPKPLFIYRVSQDGMLLELSARRHGRLWHQIRKKHAERYRMGNLVRLWWRNRRSPGKISLPVSLALLMLAKSLPDDVFGWMFQKLLLANHRRRAARGAAGSAENFFGALISSDPAEIGQPR